MFSSVCTVLGGLLSALRFAKPVSLSYFKQSFSVVFFQPYVANSFINPLALLSLFILNISYQNPIFFSQTHSAYLQTAVVCYQCDPVAMVAVDPYQAF